MADTRTEYVACGDRHLPVQVPRRTRTLTASPPLPAVADIARAVRNAIADPIAHEP